MDADGHGPLLARAAWAAVLMDADGFPSGRRGGGAVCEVQPAPRAELLAALWVAEGSAGLAPVFKDCDCGVKQLAQLRSQVAQQHPCGRDGDLWMWALAVLQRMQCVLAHVRGAAMRWR